MEKNYEKFLKLTALNFHQYFYKPAKGNDFLKDFD